MNVRSNDLPAVCAGPRACWGHIRVACSIKPLLQPLQLASSGSKVNAEGSVVREVVKY